MREDWKNRLWAPALIALAVSLPIRFFWHFWQERRPGLEYGCGSLPLVLKEAVSWISF